jgi:hypothetical protein
VKFNVYKEKILIYAGLRMDWETMQIILKNCVDPDEKR